MSFSEFKVKNTFFFGVFLFNELLTKFVKPMKFVISDNNSR